MKAALRAIGFDLGETLLYYRDTPLNWASLYPDALAAVAKACNVSPASEQLALAEQILKRHNTRLAPRAQEVSADEIFSSVLEAWSLDHSANRLKTAIEAFFNFFRQRLLAYPETLSTLKALRERGVPIGVLTDVPYGMPREFVLRDLADAGLAHLFDTVLTSVDVGRRKPEIPGYHQLAAQLGVAPREMLYVGNEAKDIVGATRAGARPVFLDRNNSGADHGQEFIISTLSELHEILKRADAPAVTSTP